MIRLDILTTKGIIYNYHYPDISRKEEVSCKKINEIAQNVFDRKDVYVISYDYAKEDTPAGPFWVHCHSRGTSVPEGVKIVLDPIFTIDCDETTKRLREQMKLLEQKYINPIFVHEQSLNYIKMGKETVEQKIARLEKELAALKKEVNKPKLPISFNALLTEVDYVPAANLLGGVRLYPRIHTITLRPDDDVDRETIDKVFESDKVFKITIDYADRS